MLKIDNFEVMGWEHAIRGMRNPMNSWEKSDSCVCEGYCVDCESDIADYDPALCPAFSNNLFTHIVGSNDHKLMMNLRNAGTDHRKFMRMITVYLDITAPLYWWKEFDTYKVGTVANSCSTMHKIHAKEFELEDFSTDHLMNENDISAEVAKEFSKYRGYLNSPIEDLEYDIEKLNMHRSMFLRTKDKVWWWQIIQRLPSSYNQKRTIMLNYEVLANIYKSRRHHKLDEWHVLCDWIEKLPYSELITGGVKNENPDE